MIARLMRLAIEHRVAMVGFAILVCIAGVVSYLNEQIEAYPDISGQMVQVITTFPGRAPEDVERQVTVPIERAMASVPKLETIRSRTIFGLSIVQLSFEEGTESYWARARVLERLTNVDFPDDASPTLGALATAYGEVYRYELRTDGTHDVMELRTLNDWVVIPRLLRTPGVADVSNFGGLEKQYAVTLNPSQLVHFGLSLTEIITAITTNNATAGGSVVRQGSMSFVVRGQGAVTGLDDLGAVFIKSVGGTPVYVRDVATVELNNRVPSGIYSRDDRDQAVEGIVLMRRGENPSAVLQVVKSAIEDINKGGYLPEGVTVDAFYDRSTLVNGTLKTVSHSVVVGITLVVLVLVMFLGSPQMAALVAATIPFSLCFALFLMYVSHIPIGLLSVGAIDFGIIVDGAVIMTDNIARRLGRQKEQDCTPTVLAAALEVERPIFFSVLMIVGAYLPLLTLRRIEGLLFRPMALTLTFALVGALLFALFVVPALATIVFKNGHQEFEHPVLVWLRPRYTTLLGKILPQPKLIIGAAALVLVLVCALVVPSLGTEFLPYMDEGVIWVRANFPEGTALEQTSEYGKQVRAVVRAFPDVNFISVQAGRNDAGTDPFPPSRMEIMIGPKPRDQWTEFSAKKDLVRAIGDRLRTEFPTTRFNFTQPIIDSVTEDTNGTSANLAVEFTGSDSQVLRQLAQKAVALLRTVPGAADVNVEQEGPQPQLVITPDRARCARYDVPIEDVRQLIDTALGGDPVSVIYEGERRFDVVVRFNAAALASTAAVGRLPVTNNDDVPIPLSQVANIRVVDGQTLIAREGGRRRVTVRSDIVGRDQGGFVKDAQKAFEGKIEVPAGVTMKWLGMYENLERAGHHFLVLIPITVGLIYVLLFFGLHSHRAALIVLLSVPFAFVGGVIALAIRGMHMNVSSGVGFAALFGVSIMNGVVMVEWVNALRARGMPLDEALIEGAADRLRPILMASIVAILGLLPASLSDDLGSDVQRPLATVIVWGLFSSTLLTLLLVPVLYRVLAPEVIDEPHGS